MDFFIWISTLIIVEMSILNDCIKSFICSEHTNSLRKRLFYTFLGFVYLGVSVITFVIYTKVL
jgi:hypothetical protein